MSGVTDGCFVWYECMTADGEAAARFYSELFNWKIEEVDMGPAGMYRMIKVGDVGIGGIAQVDPSQGIPPNWMGYVGVSDVDAAVADATANGARVPLPAMDIPGVGRFAIIADPTGGHIAPYTSAQAGTAPPKPELGHFCWRELLTRDIDRAKAFYPSVFGWDVEAMDVGPQGTYWIMKRGDAQEAGMMQMPPDAEAPTHWMYYVLVENVDESTERAKSLGAKLFVEPRDIPGIGRFAVAQDPQGASFALFQGVSG